jgi:carboxy-terminal domain RNA polymerase II polypeptide A small phosphatase
VYCNEQLSEFNPADIQFAIDGRLMQCLLRPGVEQFITRAAETFELVLWTKWPKTLADSVMYHIDPSGLVAHRLYNDSCLYFEHVCVKHLGNFGRDKKRVVIIDQDIRSWGLSLDNGIPIKRWTNNYADNELLTRLYYLESLAYVRDVTPYIKDKYHLMQTIVRTTPAPKKRFRPALF